MKSFNVPGIYITKEKINEPCVEPLGPKATGFVGLTEKGPINTPVYIKSFGEFQEIFGNFTDFSYLPFSIYGFFQTGGIECYVVRIAHISKSMHNPGIKPSSIILRDRFGVSACSLIAETPGSWGNNIYCRLWHSTGLLEALRPIFKKETNVIELKHEHNFMVGDFVKLNCCGNDFFLIKSISGNKIVLDKMIKPNLNVVQIFISEIIINIDISYNCSCESYSCLSLNPLRDNFYINRIENKSKFINIEFNNNIIPLEFNGYLKFGKDGLLSLTPGDFIGYYKGFNNYRGLGCFESLENIGLLSCPDSLIFYSLLHNKKDDADKAVFSIYQAMIMQCEKMSNRFSILDFDCKDIQEILEMRGKYNTKNAGLYYPFLKIVHPSDTTGFETVNVPPSGHMAGLYTYCDKNEGLYRAPANYYLLGVVGLSREVDNEEYAFTYSKGINSFKIIPGRGVKPWGAKTLSLDKNWIYISVRRLFLGILNSIKNSASWAVFEINDKRLRKRLIRFISAFLIELWRDGYLKGSTSEEAFYVKCDSENNDLTMINNGLLQVYIGVSIIKPTEYINIKLLGDSENAAITLMDE